MRQSSLDSWPGLLARRWLDTSADESASPARRSGLWRRTSEVFSALEGFGSGTGVLFVV